MPKLRRNKKIQCRFFAWILRKRGGYFYADGRSNRPPAGKHSLATNNEEEACQLLVDLDLRKAVDLGRADPSLLKASDPEVLSLEAGWKLYQDRISRARALRGLAQSSQKRYRAILEKFISFAKTRHVVAWNHVTNRLVEDYLDWLDKKGFAHASLCTEAITIKQLVKWLIAERKIPGSCRLTFGIKKPNATTRHCWTQEEVSAMIDHCMSKSDLRWMHGVIVGLSRTGLRISELASLRWSDLCPGFKTITLTDERSHARSLHERRTTKSGRDRTLPVHDSLKVVLEQIPKVGDEFIFHGPRGGRLKPDTVRIVLVREVITPLAKKFPPLSGTGFVTGRPHSFRHFFCSECANQGVPEQVVMKWLGHADSAMIRRYYHLHDRLSQQLMRELSFDDSRSKNQSA